MSIKIFCSSILFYIKHIFEIFFYTPGSQIIHIFTYCYYFIHQLNQIYRQRDRPTDVLSFSQREGEFPGPEAVLGDVVISIETAERQATERGHSLRAEILELLAHGLLHLLGFDHELSDAEHERHLGKQAELLAALAHR